MNGVLRELEKRKTELAKTPPRLAEAQSDRIARTLDSWKTSCFCDVHDRADPGLASRRGVPDRYRTRCTSVPRERIGLT